MFKLSSLKVVLSFNLGIIISSSWPFLPHNVRAAPQVSIIYGWMSWLQAVYMQQLPCYHIWLFRLAVPLSLEMPPLFTVWQQLVIKAAVSVSSLFCLPLAPTPMCGCLRIACKHLYCCYCSKGAELCLKIHSVDALLGKMFNCLLTRGSNHMGATWMLKTCWSSMWASQGGYVVFLLVPDRLLVWVFHQLLA